MQYNEPIKIRCSTVQTPIDSGKCAREKIGFGFAIDGKNIDKLNASRSHVMFIGVSSFD